jgi:hypothetical protein
MVLVAALFVLCFIPLGQLQHVVDADPIGVAGGLHITVDNEQLCKHVGFSAFQEGIRTFLDRAGSHIDLD